MFNSLKQRLNLDAYDNIDDLQNDQAFDTMETEDVYADLSDIDPDEVLDDPSASFEMKKNAIQQIKDRYLKPRDNNNE